VLLIACANISGLQLARHVGRRRDLAVHAALGASRTRQIRQQLAEALILAVPAGYAGLILGVWVLAAVGTAAPALIGLGLTSSPGAVVILYTFMLSILAGLACALASTWSATPPGLQALLADRGTTGDGSVGRFRAVLVAVEVALSVLVLVGAALLVSSLVHVLNVDPGFTFDRGLVINLDLPESQYPDPAVKARFFDQVIERVDGLPGVEATCAMTAAPLAGHRGTMTWVPEGQTRMIGSLPTTISPQCFEVLGIPLKRGRGFTAMEAERVAIVSESLARRLFPEVDPIGQRIHRGIPGGPLFTIVGVAGDIRKSSLESSYGNQIWLPNSGPMYPPKQLVVRTTVPPGRLAGPIRTAIRAIDPNLPVSQIETMAGVRARGLAERRFNMMLLATYGLVGLALCAVGVYGLLAQTVGQRTREIGVRMALGARPADVVRHVVGGTATSVMVGGLLGAAVAVIVSRLVRHMLFQVSPTEPAIYAAVLALVFAVALLAAYLPARRATRIDPVVAMRNG
jgi:putative ABC transport system permease protein